MQYSVAVLFRRRSAVPIALLLLASALLAQRQFRFYEEEDDLPLPADAAEKTEFVFGRLRYSSFRGGYRWGSWATDYPKADRQFLQGLRRLSRLHARSVEQVIDVDSDQMYDYPWIYAVEVGRLRFSEEQAKRMRDYLDRGGFLMVDDFHGVPEWQVFQMAMQQVFPERQIVDILDSDQIFHVLYDLTDRPQVPGVHVLETGVTYEKGGIEPHWRGIYDDKGRLVVAICHNMDLGDAWEWADDPGYPERFASVAYRIALNYIVYAMSH